MTDEFERILFAAVTSMGCRETAVGANISSEPRYQLFHAPNSLCSQKVRCVLAHHQLPYVSHSTNLFAGQNYVPEYVRLRMLGCIRIGGKLADHHGGSTSTEQTGCDGVVVPSLVDRLDKTVMVNSKQICIELDEQAPEGRRLLPSTGGLEIRDELAIVDQLPNYQLLMGRTPSGAEAKESSKDTHAAFSRRKVAWCDGYLREYPDDQVLVQAYTAKRAKESSAVEELFSTEAMAKAYNLVDAALQQLEARLAARTGTWLIADRVSMADLFWGIQLIRLLDVGLSSSWKDGRLPHVERYCMSTQSLPAIRASVLDWPGARF